MFNPIQLLGGCVLFLISAGSLPAQVPRLTLIPVAEGLGRPTSMVVAGPNEFLVGQTNGQIRLIRNGVVQTTPFLDISALIRNPTWEGIFGIALHPDYATNGYLYIHYANETQASVISRYKRSVTSPDRADPASEVVLMTIPYPAGGHRSGHLAFGADGYLYITTGDSSSGARGAVSEADRQAQLLAQNMQDLHGKMLCIDVNRGQPYAIPPTNPYAGSADGIPDEIIASGLRNPWKWSFDRQTHDLWLADVGQDGWEELNVTAATPITPPNYGWPCYEGTHPYAPVCPTLTAHHSPLIEYAGYDHNGRQPVSITGGFVYRGSASPDLQGWYVYGDYVTGTYWTLKRSAGGTITNLLQPISIPTAPISFGEGPDGELYVLSFDGKLYRLGTLTLASSQSGNWTDPATWTCGCVPTGSDRPTVNLTHTITVSQPVSVQSILLKGKVMLTSGGVITF